MRNKEKSFRHQSVCYGMFENSSVFNETRSKDALKYIRSSLYKLPANALSFSVYRHLAGCALKTLSGMYETQGTTKLGYCALTANCVSRRVLAVWFKLQIKVQALLINYFIPFHSF
jgi:hypothetical protein